MTRVGRSLIINAYSYRNAGDAAIMLSTARILKDLGAVDVRLSTRYPDSEDYDRHQIEVVSEILPFPERTAGTNNALRALRALGVLAIAMGLVLVARISGPVARAAGKRLFPNSIVLMEVQTLAIAGGGYMYSARRWLNLSLWHSMISIRYCQLFVPRTVMFPQSVGPIKRRIDQMIVSYGLRRTDPVIRETESLAASTYRPTLRSAALTPDIAFYPHRAYATSRVDRASRPLVRVAVMDWRWSASTSPDAFDRYLSCVARLADSLAALGAEVVFGGHSRIPEHDQDDIVTALRIAALCSSPVQVDPNCDVDHLAEQYANSSVTIGTRLHACIMSLALGTPAVALAYQEKAIGVLRGADLGEHAFWASDFDVEEVSSLVWGLTQADRQPYYTAARRRAADLFNFYRKRIEE